MDANDGDPDFILTGRKKIEERHSIEEEDASESLSYLYSLKNRSSSVWDLLSGDPLGEVDPS